MSFTTIRGHPGYEINLNGDVRRSAFADKSGVLRKAKPLQNQFVVKRRDGEVVRSGGPYVILTTGGTRRHVPVASLLATTFFEDYDSDIHSLKYKDKNDNNAVLANLYFVDKRLSKIHRKLDRLSASFA